MRESSDNKLWARNELQAIPAPAFGSTERATILNGIRQKEIEINRLNQEVFRSRAIISPIRTLPNEVLVSIFGFWLSTPLSFADECDRFAFMLVCRQWRNVAVNNPGCWSDIKITFGSPSMTKQGIINDGERFIPHRLQLIHQFSKKMAVKLCIKFDCELDIKSGLPSTWADALIRNPIVLRSFEEQAGVECRRKGSFNWARGFFLQAVPMLPAESYAQLTRLYISTDLVLGGIADGLEVALNNLKCLQIQDTFNLRFLEYLSCPELTTLTLENVQGDYITDDVGEESATELLLQTFTRFPKLSSLTLFGSSLEFDDDNMKTSRALSFPEIKELSIGGASVDEYTRLKSPNPYSIRTLLRLFPGLTSLSMATRDISDVPTVEHLSSTWDIQRLRFHPLPSRFPMTSKQQAKSFAKLLVVLPNLLQLDINWQPMIINSTWPFTPMMTPKMLSYVNEQFFMDMVAFLRVHSASCKKLEHLRLSYTMLDWDSLEEFSKHFEKKELGLLACLISTTKCTWHHRAIVNQDPTVKAVEQEPRKIPNATAPWYRFIDWQCRKLSRRNSFDS